MPFWRLTESSKDRQRRLREERRERERKEQAAQRSQREEFLIDQEARELMEARYPGNYDRARAKVIRRREKNKARNQLLGQVAIFVLIGLFFLANNIISQTWASIIMLVYCVSLVYQYFKFRGEHGLEDEFAMSRLSRSEAPVGQDQYEKAKHKRGLRNLSIHDLNEDGEFSDEFLAETDEASMPRRY